MAAAAAAAPTPPAEPPRRDSSKAQRSQGASPQIRDPDPVRSASRSVNYILIIYTFYAIHTFYNTHYDNSLSNLHDVLSNLRRVDGSVPVHPQYGPPVNIFAPKDSRKYWVRASTSVLG